MQRLHRRMLYLAKVFMRVELTGAASASMECQEMRELFAAKLEISASIWASTDHAAHARYQPSFLDEQQNLKMNYDPRLVDIPLCQQRW